MPGFVLPSAPPPCMDHDPHSINPETEAPKGTELLPPSPPPGSMANKSQDGNLNAA